MSKSNDIDESKLSSKLFLESLAETRPATLNEMPNFEIYMDQLLAYIDRQLITINKDQGLTAAMVNNYIKQGLVSRSSNKRYTRKHIVELTLIQSLKTVLQIKELSSLREAFGDIEHSNIYELFLEQLDHELNLCAEEYKSLEDLESSEKALIFALRAYANLLCCRQIIAQMED
ncbi:MAG: DUF1836 domain-containing protein [Eubacteriales bacterium]|nr:DUF1836 domain-containing protein [Eubacteriales bacterium]